MEKRINVAGVVEIIVKDVNSGFQADVYTTAGEHCNSRTFGSLQEVSQFIDSLQAVFSPEYDKLEREIFGKAVME